MVDDAWQRTLLAIDVATDQLRRSLDALLSGGEAGATLSRDLAAVLDEIPHDVLDRAQHPLSVTAKDLRGSVEQALEGRKLSKGSDVPEWLRVVDEGARAALEAFEQALAKLLKDGASEH